VRISYKALNNNSTPQFNLTHELCTMLMGQGFCSNHQCKVWAITLASTTNTLYSQKRRIWTAIKCAKAICAAISWMCNTAVCVPSPLASPEMLNIPEWTLFARKSRKKIHEQRQFHLHISVLQTCCVCVCVCPWARITLISSVCSASRQSSSTGDQGLYLKPPLTCNISEQRAATICQDYSNGPVNTQQSLFDWKFSHVMCTCAWPAHLGLTVIQDGFINSRSLCDSPTFTRAEDQLIMFLIQQFLVAPLKTALHVQTSMIKSLANLACAKSYLILSTLAELNKLFLIID